VPLTVGADPLAVAGLRVNSAWASVASDRPTTFASPQSTTSVSPYGLEIPVQHATTVRILHGVANIDESTQQHAEFNIILDRAKLFAVGPVCCMEPVNRLLQAVASNESHGIIRPAVVVLAQTVDGHNARMLKTAGDLRFQEEPSPAYRIIRALRLNLLERHFPVQLLVPSHIHLP
jgi:hypothetical protein